MYRLGRSAEPTTERSEGPLRPAGGVPETRMRFERDELRAVLSPAVANRRLPSIRPARRKSRPGPTTQESSSHGGATRIVSLSGPSSMKRGNLPPLPSKPARPGQSTRPGEGQRKPIKPVPRAQQRTAMCTGSARENFFSCRKRASPAPIIRRAVRKPFPVPDLIPSRGPSPIYRATAFGRYVTFRL